MPATALKSAIQAKYRVQALTDEDVDEFLQQLERWVDDAGNGGDKIADFLEKHPEIFRYLDKGDPAKTLYRGVGLFAEDIENLLKDAYRPSHKSVVSWTTNLKTARNFAKVHNVPGVFGLVMSRKFSPDERVIDLKKHGINVPEAEVLCFPVALGAADVLEAHLVVSEECPDKLEPSDIIKIKPVDLPKWLDKAKNLVVEHRRNGGC